MIASIETRFDDEYRAILKGFVYVHRHRISYQDSFQIIKVAAEHLVYQSDIKSEYLEQQIQLLHYSKLLLESIAKAEVEKRALPTPLDLHRALLSEPECFDYISKLIKLNSSNYSANFCICWEAFSKLKIIIHHHSSSFIKNRFKVNNATGKMIMSVESNILSNMFLRVPKENIAILRSLCET